MNVFETQQRNDSALPPRALRRLGALCRAAVIGAAVIGSGACASTLTSSVQTADDAKLDDLKTYAWLGSDYGALSTRNPDVVNPINSDRVRHAIDRELGEKGYRLVDPADADFVGRRRSAQTSS